MSIDFSEYLSCLKADADLPHTQALDASYHEAARVMSPRGLEHYLTGIKAMCGLNKGADLVLTYVQEMPRVAKEVGEDIIPEVVSALMKLASHTSGTVVALIMSSMPLAASRLGDAEVLRGYLNLLHQLSGKSPRGLRPMMDLMLRQARALLDPDHVDGLALIDDTAVAFRAALAERPHDNRISWDAGVTSRPAWARRCVTPDGT